MNPASERMLESFLNPNLPPALKAIAEPMYSLAKALAENLDSNVPAVAAEVAVGLHKLREAKDCFVIAAGILSKPKKEN